MVLALCCDIKFFSFFKVQVDLIVFYDHFQNLRRSLGKNGCSSCFGCLSIELIRI